MCVLVLVLTFASSSASTSANASTSAGISLMCVLVLVLAFASSSARTSAGIPLMFVLVRVPASVMRVLVQKILPVLIEVYQTVALHLGASSGY